MKGSFRDSSRAGRRLSRKWCARPAGAVQLLYITLTLAYPAVAEGQERSLRDILSFLVTNQAIPTADVIKDREAAEVTLSTLRRAMLLDLATLPLATASSAFTYRFNTSLGTLDRLAQSFGPFLVDRAVTTGSRQTAIGVTYRYATFTSLDGRDLRNGTLVTTANRFRDEPTSFDVEALTLRAAASTVTAFGNVGVTDWLDIGAAVPVVRFDLSGERVNTYRGARFVQARAAGTVTGLADIALRAKAQIIGAGVSGLATGLEVRLPTGDPDNLSGAGRSGFETSLIGSLGRGPFDIHVNAAVAAGGVSRQIEVAAAIAIAATPRLTVSAEILTQRVKELGEIAEVVERHPLITGVDTIRLSSVGTNATRATGVAGVRWNLTRTWLVSAHLLIPAVHRGLRATPIPTVSVDYAFER